MPAIATLDRWLANHRSATLIVTSIVSWSISICGFFALRYIDAAQLANWQQAFIGTAIASSAYLLLGLHSRIFQGGYIIGSKDEAIVITRSVISSGVILYIASDQWPAEHLLPLSTVFGGTMGALFCTLGASMIVRLARETSQKPSSAEKVLIFGAGPSGQQLIDNMLGDPDSIYIPVGILDDGVQSRYIRVRGIPYLGNRTAVASAAAKTGATTLVIAVTDGSADLYRDLNSAAQSADLSVKTLPPLSALLNREIRVDDLNDLNVADLLGRVPLDTDVDSIADYLAGRVVLVTGAGGSIGSELCRQIQRYAPSELIMLDRDESALHALQLSLSGRALLDTPDVVLADIRDGETLTKIFARHSPDVVFHAAALKHLPMLEQYPDEAWKTNVLGTLNVLEAAQASNVSVFVNISTDKAADPTSVLGHSKRIAEQLTAAIDQQHDGRYVSVRFGNVLGSRGSVLSTFMEQIAKGGPVTVTHPDVTRYFMTIPEAVQLVIQAAAFGKSGDALVLDMGTPVRIIDVAQQLIDMSHKHIEITFTGLRTGEKLHEDLFGSEEVHKQTQHQLITRVSVPAISITKIRAVDSSASVEMKLLNVTETQAPV
jgi:FlaA1/EpsC-like NDP-sugar epimerase